MKIQAAGIVIARKNKDQWEYLLVKNSLRHEWGFPKGHLEEGETLRECALREVKEESGLENFEFCDFRETITYTAEGGTKEVTYFLARCPQDVFKDKKVTLSGEHEDYRWASEGEVVTAMIYPQLGHLFQRAHEKNILKS